jgi:malate dehydrogenase (quinone)
MTKVYTVAVIGGGITGGALLHMISKYTSIDSMVLIEKYGALGQVNSHWSQNSQTEHFGDIETNYSLEKATIVKRAAAMNVRYLTDQAPESNLYVVRDKMVLGVGEAEVAELHARHEAFRGLFPHLRYIDAAEIAAREPMVMEGRNLTQPVAALYTPEGYTVDFGALTGSLITNAQRTEKSIDLLLNTDVAHVRRVNGVYELETENGIVRAHTLAICAGAYSLSFAHELGIGRHLSVLPVGGDFYYANEQLLNAKVYTVQHPKLPFAALHGDPEVHDQHITRFGPTAKVLPQLERRNIGSMVDFLKALNMRVPGSVGALMRDGVIRNYIIHNFMYDLPGGKKRFAHDIQKIIPTLTAEDLHYADGVGGLRPQLLDTHTKQLLLGEGKLFGENVVVVVTPSPGASTAISNAADNARSIVSFFNGAEQFDEGAFARDYGN